MRLAVLTSGGDAPGMNAAIRVVVKTAAAAGAEVLGVERGYEGLMDGRLRSLTELAGGRLRSADELDVAASQGGTVLGSVRSARFMTQDGRASAARTLADNGVGGLVVIGGNGSLAGAHALATEHPVAVVGIPASIDNDLGATSTAIGVDTALNTILEACDRISDTARAHRRAFVVEVMGRRCGYLAMASAIAAGADAVLFPEQPPPDDEIVARTEAAIRAVFDRGGDARRALVIKAEGVEFPTTRLVRELAARMEVDLPGVDVRAVVLGHVVRGGAPSFQDRMVAARLGRAAAQLLLSGGTDRMVAWRPERLAGHAETDDSSVTHVSLEQVLLETDALLDGTAATTRRRVAMMQAVEGVMLV
jgi:6-phosphofructokinase 1